MDSEQKAVRVRCDPQDQPEETATELYVMEALYRGPYDMSVEAALEKREAFTPEYGVQCGTFQAVTGNEKATVKIVSLDDLYQDDVHGFDEVREGSGTAYLLKSTSDSTTQLWVLFIGHQMQIYRCGLLSPDLISVLEN